MKLKLTILFICSMFCTGEMTAQGGIWTWMNGDSVVNAAAVYGVLGTPSSANTPQGLYGVANWIDDQGRFWLFGGQESIVEPLCGCTVSDYTGDLWMYNPYTNMWTGIKQAVAASYGALGVASSTNNPGARGQGCITWTDKNGYLWLYGGAVPGGVMSDLWKYNTVTNEWTWMGGSQTINVSGTYGSRGVASSTNWPGQRYECNSSWVDNNNNLWFFGGSILTGSLTHQYNDLWKYDISTKEWTWMKGPQTPDSIGNYGVLNTEATSNLPPPRESFSHWQDATGNFYVWAGENRNTGISYDDVWRYNPVTNNWAWVAGDSSYVPGNYRQYCTDNGTTGPAHRAQSQTPVNLQCTNNFLGFGGAPNNAYGINDLWFFNSQSFNWKWLSGGTYPVQPGVYGTLGASAGSNLPPARYSHALWMDSTGVLWLFGGANYIGSYYSGYNDMWKFTPDTACVKPSLLSSVSYSISGTSLCKGDTVFLTLNDLANPGISPASSVTWLDSAHVILTPVVTTGYVISGQTDCKTNDSAIITITVSGDTTPPVYALDTILCVGDSAILTISGISYPVITPSIGITWLDSLHAAISPASNTVYTISGRRLCGSAYTASFTIHTVPYDTVILQLSDTQVCNGDTILLAETGLSNPSVTPAGHLTIMDSAHILLYPVYNTVYTITGTTSCGSTLSKQFNVKIIQPVNPGTSLSDSVICRGDSAVFTLSALYSAQISPLSGVLWQDSNHIILFPDTTTTYNVSAQKSCGSGYSQVFTLHVLLPSSVSIQLTDTSVCRGDTTMLAVAGISNVVISPLPGTLRIDSFHLALFPDSSVTYILSGQTSCGANYVQHIHINVFLPAPVIFQLSDSAICRGDSATIHISGLSKTFFITPSSGVNVVDSSLLTLFPDSTTTYSIMSENSCGNTYSTTVTEHVFPLPAINILLTGDTLMAHTSIEGNFIWYFNGAVIPGATSGTIIAFGTGTYTATLIDSNGCTATSDAVLITVLENISDTKILIYPNPSTGTWQLSLPDALLGSMSEIYNATGQLIYQSEIRSPQSEINIPNAANGVYELRIISPQTIYVKKLVKM